MRGGGGVRWAGAFGKESGGPEMHNPPPYVGINSADPPQSIG